MVKQANGGTLPVVSSFQVPIRTGRRLGVLRHRVHSRLLGMEQPRILRALHDAPESRPKGKRRRQTLAVLACASSAAPSMVREKNQGTEAARAAQLQLLFPARQMARSGGHPRWL